MKDINSNYYWHNFVKYFGSFTNICNYRKSTEHLSITKRNLRDLRNFNVNAFLSDCLDLDCENSVYGQTDANLMCNDFSRIFFNVCNKHAPFKQSTKANQNIFRKPLMTLELIKLLKKKKITYIDNS